MEGWPVGGHGAVRVPVAAEPPGDTFFPCFGISASKSSEAALFFPRGEEALASPSRLSSIGEVTIPPIRVCSVWSAVSLFFPSPFPEGILLSTRSSILGMVGPDEPSGSGAGHLILSALLSHSWPRRIFRIMTMTNINEVSGFKVTYLGI